MPKLLGWGANTLSRSENGNRPDKHQDKSIRLALQPLNQVTRRDYSPVNLYGLSLREVGDYSDASSLRFEAGNTTALVGPDDPIVLTRYSKHVEHDSELAVVIGKTCAHLGDDDDPFAYVLGYTCLNDVSARDLQKSDVQFARAKGFDSFCPVGPHIETQLEPRDVLVEARVNGQLRQSGRTSLMIYPVAYLIRWISRMMTLLPGDVIATGTPAGVGPIAAGDQVDVSVSGIGVLHNPVHPPAN